MQKSHPSVSKTRYARRRRGNILILCAGLVMILIVASLATTNWGLLIVSNYRLRGASEAAALAAARDLPRIVINDPHFGYIALVDYPPIGKATLAGDGEPLPVTGINTIIATARLDYLIALSTGSDDFVAEAQEEVRQARRAQRLLSRALKDSLDPKCKSSYADLNGEKVTPYKDALSVFTANLARQSYLNKAQIRDFRLQLGQLDNAPQTNIVMPEPPLSGRRDTRHLSDQKSTNPPKPRFYPAFTNVPIDDEDFWLAGLSEQCTLVNAEHFLEFHGEGAPSIVKVHADIQLDLFDTRNARLSSSACAMPNFTKDKAPAAAFVFSCPDGIPARFKTMGDVLRDTSMLGSYVVPMVASAGDFPVDKGTSLQQDQQRTSCSVRREFNRGFLHWLRSAHSKPSLSSVQAFLDAPLRPTVNPATGRCEPIVVCIKDDGSVVYQSFAENPFADQTIYENQSRILACDSVIGDGRSWTVSSRDLVSNLGTISGGKHAGQPLPPTLKCLFSDDSSQSRAPVNAGQTTTICRSNYIPGRLAFEFQIAGPRALEQKESML